MISWGILTIKTSQLKQITLIVFVLGGVFTALGFLIPRFVFHSIGWSPPIHDRPAVAIDETRFTRNNVLQFARKSVPAEILQNDRIKPEDLMRMHLEDLLITELVRLEFQTGTRGISPDQLEKHVLFQILSYKSDMSRDVLGVIATNFAFLQQNQDILQVTDIAVRKYYDTHQEDFRRKERISLSQIIFENETMARQVYHQILISPEVFDYYANIGQQNQSDKNFLGLFHGAVGYLEIETLPTFLKDALEKLKVGEISSPVKVGDQYAIYKVLDRRPAGIAPLDEVREIISTRLLDTQVRDRLPAWIEKLYKRHKVNVDWDILGVAPTTVYWRWTPQRIVNLLSLEKKS